MIDYTAFDSFAHQAAIRAEELRVQACQLMLMTRRRGVTDHEFASALRRAMGINSIITGHLADAKRELFRTGGSK